MRIAFKVLETVISTPSLALLAYVSAVAVAELTPAPHNLDNKSSLQAAVRHQHACRRSVPCAPLAELLFEYGLKSNAHHKDFAS